MHAHTLKNIHTCTHTLFHSPHTLTHSHKHTLKSMCAPLPNAPHTHIHTNAPTTPFTLTAVSTPTHVYPQTQAYTVQHLPVSYFLLRPPHVWSGIQSSLTKQSLRVHNPISNASFVCCVDAALPKSPDFQLDVLWHSSEPSVLSLQSAGHHNSLVCLPQPGLQRRSLCQRKWIIELSKNT